MLSPFEIRIAQQEDLAAIVAIHNQAIALPYTNAYTQPFDTADRLKWFEEHKGKCPIYVAVANNEVAGWLSIGPYRSGRAALSHTKEVSYYVHNNYKGQGVASRLLQYAMQEIHNLDANVYLAIVIDKNTASIRLLEKNGFTLWGHLPEIARFNDDICGHVYYGWKAK